MSERRVFQDVKAADPELLRLLEQAKLRCVTEVVFEVCEDEVDGGYTTIAVSYGIHTQGETLDELRMMVRDAVDCYFDERALPPPAIRLRFVREEVLA